MSSRAPGGGGPGAEGAGGGIARNCLASRIVLLVLGAVALLAGLTGSLGLLGVPMPPETAGPAAAHGLLMTLGFLGTLIALERAAAASAWVDRALASQPPTTPDRGEQLWSSDVQPQSLLKLAGESPGRTAYPSNDLAALPLRFG